jgi:hypothetical protein
MIEFCFRCCFVLFCFFSFFISYVVSAPPTQNIYRSPLSGGGFVALTSYVWNVDSGVRGSFAIVLNGDVYFTQAVPGGTQIMKALFAGGAVSQVSSNGRVQQFAVTPDQTRLGNSKEKFSFSIMFLTFLFFQFSAQRPSLLSM